MSGSAGTCAPCARASWPASSCFSASTWASCACRRSISASLSLRAVQKAWLSVRGSRASARGSRAFSRDSRTRPLLAGVGLAATGSAPLGA